jgi:hypothetical protein
VVGAVAVVVTTLDGLRGSTQNLLTLVEELHSRARVREV